MKLRIVRTDGPPHGFTTVGYWFWSKPNNRGTLTIEVATLPDWRMSLAVIGHELIEAFYCWILGITTERCDSFDTWMEGEYASGRISPEFEGGFHKDCPYRWGHILGVGWEYLCIYGTLASWRAYEAACNQVMGIP